MESALVFLTDAFSTVNMVHFIGKCSGRSDGFGLRSPRSKGELAQEFAERQGTAEGDCGEGEQGDPWRDRPGDQAAPQAAENREAVNQGEPFLLRVERAGIV